MNNEHPHLWRENKPLHTERVMLQLKGHLRKKKKKNLIGSICLTDLHLKSMSECFVHT